jgi:hypothetical protein
MDARTFILEKNSAALEELKAIDAEYLPRRSAALELFALTEKWMDELAAEELKAAPVSTPREPVLIVEDNTKESPETWRSARDLQPRVRQTA